MNITGMWMWPQNIRIHGADKVVSYCTRAKVTDIYFLTKGLSGTVAYRSSIAPIDEPRDLLQELLDAAHARGIRVHAWFTSASDERYKQQHPQSGRCHFKNGKDKGLISFADADYIAYMEQVTRELCRNYAIDGLHLDYIRYNHLLYGWSEEDLARYAAEGADISYLQQQMQRMFYGNPPEETLLFDAYRAGDASAHALARARRKDVVHFAQTLTHAAREEKPGIILSAALMPEGAYDDIAFSDLHYGQNYEDAASLYDYVLPMAYSKAYDKDGQWVKMVAEGTLRRGMRVVMGLHAYEGGTGITLQEDVAALADTAVEGICLFREGASALAYVSGNMLCVYNPMQEGITRIITGNASESVTLDADIAPGEEKSFPLPFTPAYVRAFCADAECCIHLTAEA